MRHSVWIGFDPVEADEFAVACVSTRKHWSGTLRSIALAELRAQGLYTRPTETRAGGQLWDVVSNAPMSTEFAVSRFLTPFLARTGWALFMDCDVLVRRNLRDLFALADPRYAVMCVQHEHVPSAATKMGGLAQTRYARKNWSSVMLFNCAHPANERLTLDMVNGLPGRDLHRFCWLSDDEIGALPLSWNWLVGVNPPVQDPAIVHFTLGSPRTPGLEHQPFANEWRNYLGKHHGRARRTA